MDTAQTIEQPQRRYFAAEAELNLHENEGRPTWTWDIGKCPNCGEGHRHGGERFGNDPRAALGHRVAHCTTKPSAAMVEAAAALNVSLDGYILVDENARSTADMLDALANDEDAEFEAMRLTGSAA